METASSLGYVPDLISIEAGYTSRALARSLAEKAVSVRGGVD